MKRNYPKRPIVEIPTGIIGSTNLAIAFKSHIEFVLSESGESASPEKWENCALKPAPKGKEEIIFPNFSCMFLNPNIFFQFLIVVVY